MVDMTLPARRAVADVVFAYRRVQGERGQPLPLREFAAALNEVLGLLGGSLSYQTVKNWEDRVNLPRLHYMVQLAIMAQDWRRDFGEDMLAALQPSIYRPASEIGRRALERSLIETGPHKTRRDGYYVFD